TNRPRTYPTQHTRVPKRTSSRLASTTRFTGPPRTDRGNTRSTQPSAVRLRRPEEVAAAMAAGKRPDPFRTGKLSPPAPTVVRGRPGGRAGHRRTTRNVGLLSNDR